MSGINLLREMDLKKIERAVISLLEAIGEDPKREGLARTPQRIARMYKEIFAGVSVEPKEKIQIYSTENQDEMIIIRDIPFYSMCEHHLLPFSGKVSIAYIPNNNQITGFSNLVEVVELYSKRPQLQERMTTQIAESIMEVLKPKGVLVVVKARHMCLEMRGVKKPEAKTVTSAMRGILRQTPTRMEAFSLIGG